MTITYTNKCTYCRHFKWDIATGLNSRNFRCSHYPRCARLQITIEPVAVPEGIEECEYTSLNHDDSEREEAQVNSYGDDYFIHKIIFAEINCEETTTHRIECRKKNGTFKN